MTEASSNLHSKNMVIAYHEIERHSLDSVRKNGLHRNQTSDKDTDIIVKTNKFLDDRRPKQLVNAGVSRIDAVYCYLSLREKVIDITSGDLVSVKEIITDDKHPLLALKVEIEKCYVSDLDTYDTVKDCLEKGLLSRANIQAKKYWERLINYAQYETGDIKRPELLVTYDIPASAIVETYQSA